MFLVILKLNIDTMILLISIYLYLRPAFSIFLMSNPSKIEAISLSDREISMKILSRKEFGTGRKEG